MFCRAVALRHIRHNPPTTSARENRWIGNVLMIFRPAGNPRSASALLTADVVLQLLNLFLLIGDDCLHKITNRDHADHAVVFYNR